MAQNTESNSVDSPGKAPSVRRESDRKAAARSREGNLGGLRLKLSVVGTIEGCHLYWANDTDGEIEQLLSEGFDFVAPSEVRMTSHIVKDTDLDLRVSRYVGKDADGSPLRAYLMKCPDDIWEDRENDRYVQASARDMDIRRGQVQPDKGRYMPRGIDISLDTQFKKEY